MKIEIQKELGFLPRLESLCGTAAVTVVGYHASGDPVLTGMAPVVLFVVLSGFVLACSLERNSSATAHSFEAAFSGRGATIS